MNRGIKWINLKPIKASTGKVIARAFEEHVLFKRNSSRYFVSENGREFRILDKILKDYPIKRTGIQPYYVHANPAERELNDH